MGIPRKQTSLPITKPGERTRVVNGYLVVVCCDEMDELLMLGRAVPTGYRSMRSGVIVGEGVDLDLVGDEYMTITTMHYCPNCGAKVEIRN